MRTALKWRYVVLGLGFLGLGGVRAEQGAPWWAVLFVLAAAVNGWLAVHEAPPPAPDRSVNGTDGTGGTGGTGGTDAVGGVDRSLVEHSLQGHRASARQWQVLGAAGVAVGGGLLLLEPSLAVIAGAAALFALHRAHRAGRAVVTLRQARAVHH